MENLTFDKLPEAVTMLTKEVSEDGYYDLNGIALDTRLMFNVYDSGITFLEDRKSVV